jgi:hypothetical protein
MPKRTDISSILIIGAGLISLAGCGQKESGVQKDGAASVTQAKLDAMSDACRAPRTWLKHRGGEEVQFQPSPDAKYETVDCVLGKLKESLLPLKMGFVGNERYGDEQEDNAQKN